MKLATIKDGRNGDDAAQGKGREGKGSKEGRNVWGRVVAGSYPCLPDGKRPLACTVVKFNGVKSVGQE